MSGDVAGALLLRAVLARGALREGRRGARPRRRAAARPALIPARLGGEARFDVAAVRAFPFVRTAWGSRPRGSWRCSSSGSGWSGPSWATGRTGRGVGESRSNGFCGDLPSEVVGGSCGRKDAGVVRVCELECWGWVSFVLRPKPGRGLRALCVQERASGP